MRITSEREEVRTVAQRWAAQYGGGCYSTQPDKVKITSELKNLDAETATAADVAQIIGNNSWVEPWKCRECGAENWDVVELGDEPDYESYTTYACISCLEKAVDLVSGRSKKEKL